MSVLQGRGVEESERGFMAGLAILTITSGKRGSKKACQGYDWEMEEVQGLAFNH